MDNQIFLPTAPGEAMDRYVILLIKNEKINSEHVKVEFEDVTIAIEKVVSIDKFKNSNFFRELDQINRQLWDLEDEVRTIENNPVHFGKVCMKICKLNDKRCEIKQLINEEYHSDYSSKKIYN